jgi:FkbM family methyltransferase
VGANWGQYARLARAAFPNAKIYSFEPNPAAFSRLREAAKNLHLEAVPLGCGAQPGFAVLFDADEDSGSETATMVAGTWESQGKSPTPIPIEITSIDAFCEEQGIDRISLLKIDVEGYEKEVLRGASRTIARTDVIQLEFNEMNLLSRTYLDEIESLLPGFVMHRLLYDGNLVPLASAPPVRRNLFTYQNLVAIRAAS